MTSIPAPLFDAALSRAQRYATTAVPYLEDVDMRAIHKGVLGASSILDIPARHKWKSYDSIYERVEDTHISYSDIVIAYLDQRLTGIGRKKLPYLKASLDMLDWNPPLYCRPGQYDEMVYADLRAAYPSIYLAVGLDVQLHLDANLVGIGAIIPDDFPLLHHRASRNMLYGITRSRHIVGINDGRTYFIPRHGNYLNPSLHGAIMLVLHDIAEYALSVCCPVYVHTDGYIIPDDYFDDLAAHAATLGLELRRKSMRGPAHVMGLGRYRVADKRSYWWNVSADIFPREYEPLDELRHPIWPKLRSRLTALL